jgi:CubicO group peptidase (beta-lactamase class C family)
MAPAEPSTADSSAARQGLVGLPAELEREIDAAVAAALAAGKLPGCVVLVGRHDATLFARAYGSRERRPDVVPMTLDTVFDLASLTKPVATASSVIALAERGVLDLDRELHAYLPELGPAGRATLRQVLLHTGGFAPDTPVRDYDAGPEVAVTRIARRALRYEPGRETRYSDVGYFLLGEVVRRVTRVDLATFAQDQVFAPLGMTETSFLPSSALRARAAPTESVDGRWLVGEVHDPRARAVGGVAGHAGLFSTGRDLALFARSLLPGGSPSFLSARGRQAYTAPYDVPGAVRALGWDVRSAYSSNRGVSLSPRAFGHGGFTGTSLWVDPAKDLFVIFLSNRVHPDGHGEINPLAGAIADLAATVVGQDERAAGRPCGASAPEGPVLTGLEVLARERFARLRGARVGLITNAAGVTTTGERDVDLLAAAEGVELVAVFAPEHGLATNVDAPVADAHDGATGLPVYSLYGYPFTALRLVGGQ